MARRLTSGVAAASAAFVLVLMPACALADALSDLRQVLNRYPANGSFAASGTVRVQGGAEGATRGGSSSFEVESGPTGFTIRVLPEEIEAAGAEAVAKKLDPNSPTPKRTAMVALSIFEIMDSIDAASMLLQDLSGAVLIERKATTRGGQPSTQLRIKVKPSFAAQGRFVNEPKIELRVWLGVDGVPIAAERDSEYSASFLFVKAGNVRKETWQYAVRGDRLYATRNDETDLAAVAGKSMTNTRSVTYSPK